MIYATATPQGLGMELWGSPDDLEALYNSVAKFWGDEAMLTLPGYASRENVISGFSYELRKAMEGQRLQKPETAGGILYGARWSWVQVLFSLQALRYNMRLSATSQWDLALLMALEYQVEKAMTAYHPEAALQVVPFLHQGLYGGNPYLYLFMRSVHTEFLQTGGGPNGFRQLPELLLRGTLGAPDYLRYLQFLQTEAVRLACDVEELDIDDDDIDYDRIVW